MTPASQIAHYRITSKLGEGGMGTVFRATDTKLNRDVAIKILPPAFANDPDRMARFEREAKVLASLNHPNIAAIYGVEERALVMELVEGETLSGPLPLETALDYARQIADALEAAHEKGIVHRDLKPGNIMVNSAGVVKVLDFGLASVQGSATTSGDPSISPTLTLDATQVGTILGTAAYMSPEQARGKPVDKRADIWAFGVALYEMVTGKRLFQGEDLTDILASVVKDRPDLSQVPAQLRPLIERCLEKDPKNRLRDIGDMDLLLDAGPATPEARVVPQPDRLPWILAGVLAVACGVSFWAPWRTEKQVERRLTRLDVDLGEDVSFLPPRPSGSAIAISPDGTRLAYVSNSGRGTALFTRRLDQTRAIELPATQGADFPFFSPDGKWIGFVLRDKLNKISVEGGAVVPLGDTYNFANASWGEDGNIVASEVFGKGLVVYAAAGGAAPQALPGLGKSHAVFAPQVLPGGTKILFSLAQASGDVNTATIEVLMRADGSKKVVARGGMSARYVSAPGRAGHLIYVNKTTLFAAPFDLDKLEARGTPVPVLDDVASSSVTGMGQFDWSRGADDHGVFVYRRAGGSTAPKSTLQWIDSAGRKEPLPVKPGYYFAPRVSPNGERIVLMVSDNGATNIMTYDPRRNTMVPVTSGGGFYASPIWSPDGRYVVYQSISKGLFQARSDGSGQPRALQERELALEPSSFAPDGKRLAYVDFSEGRPQIWTMPVEEQGGQLKAGPPEQFLKSGFNDLGPSFSPDGQWLAYYSDESGRNEVYVRPSSLSGGSGAKWQISNSGGGRPVWSRNGRDLLYSSGGQIMAVNYTAKNGTFTTGKPREWISNSGGTFSDLAPDGKRALLVTRAQSAETVKAEHEVVFLQNFFDYLRQRAPLGN